jgi:phospholipid methyltransferase
MRKLRLKWVRPFVVPFFLFATPRTDLFLFGAVLAVVGLAIRGWAAGAIHKDHELTTTGPYAFTRNPLYVGSFLLGGGIALAGGHWVWPVVFIAFYVTVYTRTMSGETQHLAKLFPEQFPRYVAAVPALLPRLTPYRATDSRSDGVASTADSGKVDPERSGDGFQWAQYRRNREWEASLGTLAAFGLLLGKARFF